MPKTPIIDFTIIKVGLAFRKQRMEFHFTNIMDWAEITQIVFMSGSTLYLLCVLSYTTYIYIKINKVKKSSPIKFVNYSCLGHVFFSLYTMLLTVRSLAENDFMKVPILNYLGQYLMFSFLMEYVNSELKRAGRQIVSPCACVCSPATTARYFFKFHLFLQLLFLAMLICDSSLQFCGFADCGTWVRLGMNFLVIIMNLFLWRGFRVFSNIVEVQKPVLARLQKQIILTNVGLQCFCNTIYILTEILSLTKVLKEEAKYFLGMGENAVFAAGSVFQGVFVAKLVRFLGELEDCELEELNFV